MADASGTDLRERDVEAKNGGRKPSPEEIAAHTASLVGFHYTVDDYYEIGREEIRKHAMAVQDAHPTHWSEEGAKAYGHDTLIAAPTYVSVLGIIAQRKLFEDFVTGYDLSLIHI